MTLEVASAVGMSSEDPSVKSRLSSVPCWRTHATVPPVEARLFDPAVRAVSAEPSVKVIVMRSF